MKYVRSDRAKRSASRKILAVAVIILLIAVLVSAFFVFSRKKQQANLNDVTYIKSSIGKLYLLPSNEQPALATVTNSSKLTSSFAGKVKNGDKILIYQNNKQAIVYRPSIDKIIDVEPVVIDDVNSLKGNK